VLRAARSAPSTFVAELKRSAKLRQNMAFADEMIPPLRILAKKLIDQEMYAGLSSVADLLTAFKSGNWPKLSYEDQEIYLQKMSGTFHPRGMGDSEIGQLPEYQFVIARIMSEEKAVRKKK
jgi:hypothetical protein